MSVRRSPKKSPAADWHKADVIAALHKRGTSLRRLALDRGLNSRTLTKVLRHPYLVAEQLIAREIGVSAVEIWPSRYDPDTRIGARRLAQQHASRPTAARNVERADKGARA